MNTKSLLLSTLYLLLSSVAFSQIPNLFKYQSVIRKSDGSALVNQSVKVRISLIKGSVSGLTVYSEVHSTTSNAFGILNLNIGEGSDKSGSIASLDWSTELYFIKIEIDETGGTNYTLSGISQLLSVPYALYAKNAGNGFSGNYLDLTNKPNLLDTSKYLKIEKDPIFNTSIAKGIKTSDTVKWNAKSTFSGKYIDLQGKPDFTKWDKDSTDNVTLSDNQTITGNKIFNGAITVNTPINNTDAANKAYVDVLKTKIEKMENRLFEIEFALGKDSIADIDGNYYTIVKIGSQYWMAENLKTTKYNDGSVIPLITDASSWNGLSTAAYCWYNNEVSFKNVYGGLYNWYTVSSNKLCPTGWHVPSQNEWEELNTIAGGWMEAGGKLKELGINHWNNPNQTTNDNFEFTALPGGGRYSASSFNDIGNYGIWWSLTEVNISNSWRFSLVNASVFSYGGNGAKKDGYSVRCIKDK